MCFSTAYCQQNTEVALVLDNTHIEQANSYKYIGHVTQGHLENREILSFDLMESTKPTFFATIWRIESHNISPYSIISTITAY